MESISKYWLPLYNILKNDCYVVLAYHKYVKAIHGKKTDKKDAKWITDLFNHDLVARSFMPSIDIWQLRDLMCYRFKLTCFKSSEKNRLQNCLTISNIQLENIVSDTLGKSAQAILDKIFQNPENTSLDLKLLVFKSLKKKLPQLHNAIDGYITLEQAGKLKVIKTHYESLESRRQSLKNSFLRSPSLSAGTCHSSNRFWYQQHFHCNRNLFRLQYQYGGFSFGEILMFMSWFYSTQQ